MRMLSADLVIPVSAPPLRNGVVTIDEDGTVMQVGERSGIDTADLEIFQGIICPGFINAHCHLELSYMKGKIPAHSGMVQFIIDLIEYRNYFRQPGHHDATAEIKSAIQDAHNEMMREGIVGVGDISNEGDTFPLKALSAIPYYTFIECFGFDPVQAENSFRKAARLYEQARAQHLEASVTPHAPYSVSPGLFQRIFSAEGHQQALYSFHNQESKAEEELFMTGRGEFLRFMQHFQLPLDELHVSGKNSLQTVIHHFPGGNKTLFVHNVTTGAHDLDLIREFIPGSWFCLCPNANLYIGNGLPSISLFRKHQDRICIGTDSYASNHRLSVLDELITLQQHFPQLTTSELITWSTLHGAVFYNWSDTYGSIEPGKQPGLNLIGPVHASFQLQKDTMVRKLA